MDERARMAVEALSSPRRWLTCPCAGSLRREAGHEAQNACMNRGCEMFRYARDSKVDVERVAIEDGGG